MTHEEMAQEARRLMNDFTNRMDVKCSIEADLAMFNAIIEALASAEKKGREEGKREGDQYFFIREKSLKDRLQLMGEKVKELQNALRKQNS